MAQRRGSALLLAVPVIALSLFLVGCPKRPATTAASAHVSRKPRYGAIGCRRNRASSALNAGTLRPSTASSACFCAASFAVSSLNTA